MQTKHIAVLYAGKVKGLLPYLADRLLPQAYEQQEQLLQQKRVHAELSVNFSE